MAPKAVPLELPLEVLDVKLRRDEELNTELRKGRHQVNVRTVPNVEPDCNAAAARFTTAGIEPTRVQGSVGKEGLAYAHQIVNYECVTVRPPERHVADHSGGGAVAVEGGEDLVVGSRREG